MYMYSTAENTRGRELSRNANTFVYIYMYCRWPVGEACLSFVEKTFTGGYQTIKFVEVFFLKNFLVYSITMTCIYYLCLSGLNVLGSSEEATSIRQLTTANE